MKYALVVILGFLGLIACSYEVNEQITAESKPELEGRYWTSNFYFYRNVYKFDTENRGVCYEHTQANLCPIDLEKHHIAEDSMLLMRELPFEYSLSSEVLRITILPIDGDTLPMREFDIIEADSGDFQLKSTYDYAYGHEIMSPESIDFAYKSEK